MKTYTYLYLALLSLLILAFGCSEEKVEHSNPLDPQNLRTAGSPIGLQLFPGDRQATITWLGLGLKGVESYRLYRRYGDGPASKFEKIAEVKALWDSVSGKEIGNLDEKCESGAALLKTGLGRYCHLDSGLKNDSDKYFYRISYVDKDNIESPIPELLNKIEASVPKSISKSSNPIWPFTSIIPSLPPSPPEVVLGPQRDLQILLTWQNYKPPGDLDKYVVFAARVLNNKEPSQLLEVATLKLPLLPQHQFFLDEDFEKDGIVKVYKVVAIDKFGVESRSNPFKAKSPNLPPKPPRFRLRLIVTGLDTYRAVIRWDKSREADVDRYRVYSEKDDLEWELREVINDVNKTDVSLSDRLILAADGGLRPKKYFVTAVDNTERDDGNPDESDKPTPGEVAFPQR